MLRDMKALLVLFSALVLAGCGSSGNPASDAFGGLSDHDLQVFKEFSTEVRAVSTEITALGARLKAEDLAGARTQLDAIAPKLDEAEDSALNADSSDLRDTLQDYMRPIRRLTAAFDRWVTYFEDDSAPRDQAAEDRMLDDIESASADAQKADQAFLNRILDNASPEQREEIRARYREALKAAADVP